MNKGLYVRWFKRPIDFILALVGIIVLSPLIIAVSLLVRAKLGSPIIFKQKRPGLNENIFMMFKFRTMTSEKDENGNLMPDHIRLTKLGKILRSTSLDELPELFNILKGDMSIIGPRPQLIRDMVFMSEEQRERHTVLPGLSGLAQINGRNAILWDDKLSYDIEYIKNITFLGDLKILIQTVVNVFKQDGVSTEGMATAEDFGDYLLRIGAIDKKTYSAGIEESIGIG